MSYQLQEGESLLTELAGVRYAVDRDWGGLKRRGVSDVISDVCVLSDSRVCVLVRAEPSILVFSPAGELIDEWGGYPLIDGHSVRRDGSGLFAVDRDAHRVFSIDGEGKVLFQITPSGAPAWEAPFNHPTAALRARDGSIFVTDGYGNARVHRFDSQGRYESSFGSMGVEPGEFLCPHALTILNDGRIVVIDRDNNRLQVFSSEGVLQDVWRGFWRPMGITTLDGESVIVSDQSPAIHAVDGSGRHIGRCRAANDWPHGVDGSADGCIYLAEMHPTSVTRMRPLS